MKKVLFGLLLLGMVVLTLGAASADVTATQTVNMEIQAINLLTVSGNPGTLTLAAPTAGNQPAPVTDATTTYNVTTNEANKKITAAIDSAMPSGTTLSVALAATTGGTAAGTTVLTADPSDLVTGISNIAESGKAITYTFGADVTAGAQQIQKTVTFTLTNGN